MKASLQTKRVRLGGLGEGPFLLPYCSQATSIESLFSGLPAESSEALRHRAIFVSCFYWLVGCENVRYGRGRRFTRELEVAVAAAKAAEKVLRSSFG